MAHFTRLDNTNKVINIEVVADSIITDTEGNEKEELGQVFLTRLNAGVGWYRQTSYNGTFRKNYAGVGYTYDAVRDAFIEPQPYPSWTLNEYTCLWDSPVAYPTDDLDYSWDESTTNWKEVI